MTSIVSLQRLLMSWRSGDAIEHVSVRVTFLFVRPTTRFIARDTHWSAGEAFN